MAGKKHTTKKAAVGGANAADGVPTDLTAKKKHVRDLAKAGRWQEIKKQYGEKMVAKAKAYAEKNKAKHTPQSLAQEILAKNGYKSPSSVKKKDVKQLRVKTPDVVAPVVIEVSPDTLTEAQKQQIEKRRREALERRNRKSAMASVPVKLASNPVNSIAQYDQGGGNVVQNGFVHQQQQYVQAQHEGTGKSGYATQREYQIGMANRTNSSHQVTAIPDYFVQADEQNPVSRNILKQQPIQTNAVAMTKNQPSLFLDELEAAADIVNWEKEQLASEDPVLVHEISPDEYAGVTSAPKWTTQNSTTVDGRLSISDKRAAAADIAKWRKEQKQQLAISEELAAAMEIVQWEEERATCKGGFEQNLRVFSDDIAAAADVVNWELDHQNVLGDGSKSAVLAVVTDDDDPEYEQPHFQLLGTTPTVPRPTHNNIIPPICTTSTTNQPGCPQPNQQQASNASHKRKNEPAKEYLEKQQASNPQRDAPSPSPAHSRAQQSPRDLADQNRHVVDAFM